MIRWSLVWRFGHARSPISGYCAWRECQDIDEEKEGARRRRSRNDVRIRVPRNASVDAAADHVVAPLGRSTS